MTYKFTAVQLKSDNGINLDSFVLKVNGVKFGELHGIDMDGYAFFFNRDRKIIAWMETESIDVVWTGLQGGLEMAKRHYLHEAAYNEEMAEAAFEACRG